MSEVNPQLVKTLREKTNAGMMDCKRALDEAKGDLDKAEAILRTKGIAGAAKKASRATKEGIVAAYIHLQGKVGVLVEVNCETDFVAKNDNFREFVKVKGKPAAITEKIVEGKLDKFYSTVCLLDQAFIKNPDVTVTELIASKIAELGENMVIRRFTRYMVGEELEAALPSSAEPAAE